MIDKYFYDRPKKIEGYYLRQIGLLSELRILDLWRTISLSVNQNKEVNKIMININELLMLAIDVEKSDKKLLNENNVLEIENYFRFIIDNIIGYINKAAYDNQIEGYFRKIDKEHYIPTKIDEITGFFDYIAYVIFNLGYQYLDHINMSQIYILKRYQEVNHVYERLENIYDNAMSTNASGKDFRNYVKEIQKITINKSENEIKTNIKQELYKRAKNGTLDQLKAHDPNPELTQQQAIEEMLALQNSN